MRRLIPWLLVLGVVWAGQLWWLGSAVGGWGTYWYWRGVYRPGIQAVENGGGDYLPGHTFDPLSPNGARLAFVLAAGVYAILVTLLLYLTWRLSQRPRQRFGRRLRRQLA